MDKYQHAYLVKCNNCGFVFSKKNPANEELTAYYDAYPQYDISPITIKRYNELLDEFEKYRETNNILDVGCGEGFFLETAKKRGWNVFGTEYRKQAIDICQNKKICTYWGELKNSEYSNSFFDIITSFEVIEHINNPVLEIDKFLQLLREGGIVYLTTPNFNSFSRLLLGNKWNIITYPEHLSYYTPKSINYLFAKLSFSKVSLKTTGISQSRINTGLNISQKSNHAVDETIRIKTENFFLLNILKRIVNSFLTFLGTGDTLKIIYKKPCLKNIL